MFLNLVICGEKQCYQIPRRDVDVLCSQTPVRCTLVLDGISEIDAWVKSVFRFVKSFVKIHSNLKFH